LVGHSAETKNAGESPHFCFGGSVGGGFDLDSVLDMALELIGKLINAPHDFEMVPADDLPHSPLADFQVIHPALQASNVAFYASNVAFYASNVAFQAANVAFHSANVALDLDHVALEHRDIGFENGDVSFNLHDVGVHPLDRREYQIALVHHATAPETVMSLYAIHQADAIKE
jgi:hypothetical protein